MDEFTYSNDYSQTVELVDQANTEIESQNARHEMSSQIDDEDFRLLAIRGLEQEQARSVQSRKDAVVDIDYDDIGIRMLAGERAQAEIQTTLAAATAQRDKILTQARLSTRIAPDSAALIQALADQKTAQSLSEIKALTEQLDTLQAAEVGYIALGAAWNIPRVVSPVMPAEAITALPEEIPAPAKKTAAPRTTRLAEAASGSELDHLGEGLFGPIYTYVLAHVDDEKGIRVEEMRNNIPELSVLTQAEYVNFKGQFTVIRGKIVEALKADGITADWRITGQTRGVRYFLSTDKAADTKDIPQPPVQPPIRDTTPPVPTPPVAPAGPAPQEKGTLTRETITDEMTPEALLRTPLINTIMRNIGDLQRKSGAENLRRTYIATELGKRLRINSIDVQFFLDKLVEAGLLFDRGKYKGATRLSTVPGASPLPETAPPAAVEPADTLVESAEKPAAASQPEAAASETPSGSEQANAPHLSLSVLRRGAGGNFANSTTALELADVAKEFGLQKSHELAKEIEKWITWLQANPNSSGLRKVKAFKGINVGDKLNVPLIRFSPSECPELTTNGNYRYYRIVFSIIDDQLVLVDVLNHDAFDRIYK